jgi:hypothetical protein
MRYLLILLFLFDSGVEDKDFVSKDFTEIRKGKYLVPPKISFKFVWTFIDVAIIYTNFNMKSKLLEFCYQQAQKFTS